MLVSQAEEFSIDAPLANFLRLGYARLGPVLSLHAAQILGERADALMLGDVQYPGMFFQHDSPTGRYEDLVFGAGWVGPSLAYRKLEKLELDPLYAAWIENQLFARIAKAVLGNEVTLYRASLWNKAALSGMDLPWHQDDGVFWGLDRSPCLQIWTALDDVSDEAGCIEVVPGSHLGGLASPLGGTIREQQLGEPGPRDDIVRLPVKIWSPLIGGVVMRTPGHHTTAFLS